MDKAQKAAQIEYLEEVFDKSGSVVVAHYTGMTVAHMTKLRRQMQAAGASSRSIGAALGLLGWQMSD